MEFNFKIGQVDFRFDQYAYYDISIPLHFDGPQPGAFGVEPATGDAYRSGAFVGSVSEGGSCNFEKVSMVPHCNGTHTECLGHITEVKFAIREQLRDALLPATLVSLQPSSGKGEKESYRPEIKTDDLVITRWALEKALKNLEVGFLKALVIRTLPNGAEKLSRDYLKSSAPYFTVEAMTYILELGVEHLLVDLPSIDRANDQGMLTNHHLFWEIEEGSHQADENTASSRTITELVYIGEEVKDGNYILNLQVAPFQSDAAPSRPVLFEVKMLK